MPWNKAAPWIAQEAPMNDLPRLLVAAVTLGTVVAYARPAWACGQCFGDGGASALGWIALGAVGLLVYRYFSRS